MNLLSPLSDRVYSPVSNSEVGERAEGGLRNCEKLRAKFARSADPVVPCYLSPKSPFTIDGDDEFVKLPGGLSDAALGLLGLGA
jgi:hypothetical protein